MAAKANQALIQGAYQMALGGTQAHGFGKRRGSFGSFLGQVLPAATQLATKYIDGKSKEFDTAANDAINNSTGELSDKDWELRYDQAMDMRNDYIFGNKKNRAKILRDLDGMFNDQVNHDNTKISIAAGALGVNGINNSYKATKQGRGMQGILNGNTPITYNEETGEPGYILSNEGDMDFFETAKDTFLSHYNLPLDAMDDWGLYEDNNKGGQKARGRVVNAYKQLMLSTGEKTQEELDDMFGEKWYSAADVQRIIKEQSVDTVTRENILNKAQADKEKSASIVSGSGAFPYEAMYEDSRTTILGLDGVNFRSVGFDEMLVGSGRTWFKDMQEALMNSTYEELGIPLTEEEAKDMDPTEESPITAADARVITRSIYRDHDLYLDFLTSYVTKFRQQNWNQGAMMRENWNPIPFNASQQVSGGTVGSDNVWVPNQQ